MFRRFFVALVFFLAFATSLVAAQTVAGEFEGEDGQFIGSTIYQLGFNSFAEEKRSYLRGVNIGGKCAYYEGPNAPCTPEGGSFLLPGGDDLYSWYYYDTIIAAMAPYNDEIAQLKLERKGRAAACDESRGWRGDVWYDAEDCFYNVQEEYDYGKIYNKEAEQYKAKYSFFKKLNEEISKRYLTGEREAGALQALQTAFSGYDSCMGTCDAPFGASKKAASNCDNICIDKYQETLMKDFARYRKEELAILETEIKSAPPSGPLQGENQPLSGEQGEQLPSQDDLTALNDGGPSDGASKSESKIGAVFIAAMSLAFGILIWYLIFKYILKLRKRFKK
ncbi:hypothetical protein HY643_01125 [Candidatus Woesearchaeota archaeon]|nr:hypothetical protein [Candidatus Woesearchaeota archaeon]